MRVVVDETICYHKHMNTHFSNNISTFFSGTASVLDIGGTLSSQILPKTDQAALYEDWQAVGNDLGFSMKRYGEKISKSSK